MAEAAPTSHRGGGPGSGDRLPTLLSAAAVLLGGVLSVLAALNQPYNQNEYVQIEPYDSWDPAVVTSGTRQPPLDPILGALVQHAFGTGQLQQRIVPVLAGVGTLVVTALLLRRLGLRWYGVAALWFLATAPLFLRYNAYARPYALPLLLMLLCAYAGSRWLGSGEDDPGGRRRWLAVAVAAALLLPLARVPEPVVFLGSSTVVLALAGWRRWLPRARAWSLAGGLLVALGSVGALSTLKLGSQTASRTDESILDLHLGRAIERLPTGLAELRDFVVPLYADWFPWWPVTLLVVVTALAMGRSRRRLATTWWWLPMVLAPLVFLAAYHSVNPYPLDERHYRIRFAYFWMPSLVLVVAVAAEAVGRRWRTWAGLLLVGLLVASQLPATWAVLTDNDTNDVGQAAAVIDDLPSDAVVLYDGPAPAGIWRQPFFGDDRYFDDDEHPRVVTPAAIAKGRTAVGAAAGPVYLVVLDAPCVNSVACDSPDLEVGPVAGWRVERRFDRYTLYAPEDGQAGRDGAVEALESLAAAYGPVAGEVNRQAARRLG